MPNPQPATPLVDEVLALPVRTLITNVDTDERGPKSVEVPVELRDRILVALRPVEAVDAGLIEQLLSEATAMRRAIVGEDTPGSFHRMNWEDKPHRVLRDACTQIERAADALASLSAAKVEAEKEVERLREAAKWPEDAESCPACGGAGFTL